MYSLKSFKEGGKNYSQHPVKWAAQTLIPVWLAREHNYFAILSLEKRKQVALKREISEEILTESAN